MSIKSRFCPECGNETDNLVESLCVSCYSNQPIVKLPKQKNVLFCVKCEQVLNKGFWMKGLKSAEQILEERVQDSLVLPTEETLISPPTPKPTHRDQISRLGKSLTPINNVSMAEDGSTCSTKILAWFKTCYKIYPYLYLRLRIN